MNATNEMNRIIEKPSFDKASKVLENIPKSSRKVIQKPIESVSSETVKGKTFVIIILLFSKQGLE